VAGAYFQAGATPSLRSLLRDVTRVVNYPDTNSSIASTWDGYISTLGSGSGTCAPPPECWRVHADKHVLCVCVCACVRVCARALGPPDYTVFLDRLGIPSTDMSFRGSYGVYHSIYDSHYWMSQFGDPTFQLHKVTSQLASSAPTVPSSSLNESVRVSCVVSCATCSIWDECRRVRRCGV
jgi:N-acetylated-alpha-linked acidic dipeptidase